MRGILSEIDSRPCAMRGIAFAMPGWLVRWTGYVRECNGVIDPELADHFQVDRERFFVDAVIGERIDGNELGLMTCGIESLWLTHEAGYSRRRFLRNDA